MKRQAKILFVLAVLGLIVSSYLWNKSSEPENVICSIGGGCDIVLSSRFAYLFGIPVEAFGFFWYLVALLLIWKTFFKLRLMKLNPCRMDRFMR